MSTKLTSIEHMMVNPRNYLMMIPYGPRKNNEILQANIGDRFWTIDAPAKYVEIIHKVILPIKTEMANALAVFMYNIPMDRVFKGMRANWKYDINDHSVILLVVNAVKESPEKIGNEDIYFKLNHKRTREALIPLTAISSSDDFVKKSRPKVIFNDGYFGLVHGKKIVNVLSGEGDNIIDRLYNLSQIEYLKIWKHIYPELSSTLSAHIHVKLIDKL